MSLLELAHRTMANEVEEESANRGSSGLSGNTEAGGENCDSWSGVEAAAEPIGSCSSSVAKAMLAPHASASLKATLLQARA